MSSLRDRNITLSLTPQAGLAEFCPDAFEGSNQTLCLLSKNVKGGTSAAAIISALTNEVRVAADVLTMIGQIFDHIAPDSTVAPDPAPHR